MAETVTCALAVNAKAKKMHIVAENLANNFRQALILWFAEFLRQGKTVR